MNYTAILAIALVALLVYSVKQKKKLERDHEEAEAELLSRIDLMKAEMNTVHLPDSIFGVDLAYKYTDVELIPVPNLNVKELIKKEITFGFVDEQAVACVANKAIGTVGQRSIAYMIRDWLKNGDPIYAVFLNADDLTCAICFYKKGVKKKQEERSISF